MWVKSPFARGGVARRTGYGQGSILQLKLATGTTGNCPLRSKALTLTSQQGEKKLHNMTLGVCLQNTLQCSFCARLITPVLTNTCNYFDSKNLEEKPNNDHMYVLSQQCCIWHSPSSLYTLDIISSWSTSSHTFYMDLSSRIFDFHFLFRICSETKPCLHTGSAFKPLPTLLLHSTSWARNLYYNCTALNGSQSSYHMGNMCVYMGIGISCCTHFLLLQNKCHHTVFSRY